MTPWPSKITSVNPALAQCFQSLFFVGRVTEFRRWPHYAHHESKCRHFGSASHQFRACYHRLGGRGICGAVHGDGVPRVFVDSRRSLPGTCRLRRDSSAHQFPRVVTAVASDCSRGVRVDLLYAGRCRVGGVPSPQYSAQRVAGMVRDCCVSLRSCRGRAVA